MEGPKAREMAPNSFVEMGWGRLVFGHTFESNEAIIRTLTRQGYDTRDIAMYMIDPHVVVSLAPDKLFIDPSHAFRLWSHDYSYNYDRKPFAIGRVSTLEEAEAINRIYVACHMKGADPEFILDNRAGKLRTFLVARDLTNNRIIGTVTGVDHVDAFNDPENGASLWSLAVDPQVDFPGVGISLVRHLAEHYFTKGRSFVDISVMHDNRSAIALYEKLGCRKIPVYCIKRKNPINEKLYTSQETYDGLNPYARLITDEAARRGILIDIIDESFGLFNLTLGSRTVSCRESLSDMTSAVAMTICDNKALTSSILRDHGIKIPRHIIHTTIDESEAFLECVDRVVVKPTRGEQGQGISVDISDRTELKTAIQKAETVCSEVLIEELAEGEDLRIIVINYEVVAAAIRKPPVITGTGKHTVMDIIQTYNRRRIAATGGESRIPIDAETRRCLAKEGINYETILPEGRSVVVRKTANLHTGGTIHDVTADLHPVLVNAAQKTARILGIPVTGLDFIVPSVTGPDYVVIEANERPGLANHEPQPTAERFIDLLFPETVEEIRPMPEKKDS